MAVLSNPEFLEYRIPDEIMREKSVSALSDFALGKYGTAIDKRLGWDKAHKLAVNMRRVAVRSIEQKEKEEIMDKTKWPWNEGFKFFCDGPNPGRSNACYVTDIARGVQMHITEENLASFLEEGFSVPAPAPFLHVSADVAKIKEKEAAVAAEAAKVAAEAKAAAEAASASEEKRAAREASRLTAMSAEAEKPAE